MAWLESIDWTSLVNGVGSVSGVLFSGAGAIFLQSLVNNWQNGWAVDLSGVYQAVHVLPGNSRKANFASLHITKKFGFFYYLQMKSPTYRLKGRLKISGKDIYIEMENQQTKGKIFLVTKYPSSPNFDLIECMYVGINHKDSPFMAKMALIKLAAQEAQIKIDDWERVPEKILSVLEFGCDINIVNASATVSRLEHS